MGFVLRFPVGGIVACSERSGENEPLNVFFGDRAVPPGHGEPAVAVIARAKQVECGDNVSSKGQRADHSPTHDSFAAIAC